MPLAPRHLPPLDLLVADLGGTAAAARYLGLTPRTVARWYALGPPRPAHLALFWESRWGSSYMHAHAHNAAASSAQLAACLQREIDRLRAVIQRLERDHDWGSANTPIFDVR